VVRALRSSGAKFPPKHRKLAFEPCRNREPNGSYPEGHGLRPGSVREAARQKVGVRLMI
jgi:hypothetical protein